MDSKDIRELIDLISRSNFRTFELEREGFRLKLVKADGVAAEPAATVAGEAVAAVPDATQPAPPAGEEPAAADGLHEVTSPIVGTFYRSPSPDASPFVEVGSRVQRGQVLCIVEAMKVMNEIESEIDAEVVEVPAEDGHPVEYGEVLFRLRP